MLVRTFLNQKSCGDDARCSVTIVQYAHPYGPNARLMKAKRSYSLPEYQAMKNSIA